MTEKTAQKEPGKKPVSSKKPKPQQEVVVQIPLSELHPFPDHPFQVREDASMQETAESVKEYGVLVPALARPREDGGYGAYHLRSDPQPQRDRDADLSGCTQAIRKTKRQELTESDALCADVPC